VLDADPEPTAYFPYAGRTGAEPKGTKMRPTAKTGATKWDARATDTDTYAGATIECPCGCGGQVHRNLDAFILHFAPYVDATVRADFIRAVVDPQERHERAGDDERGTWTGCARTNRRAQTSDDAPVLPTDVTPVTNGDADAIRRDEHRRMQDERRRRWSR
jgi:hypothetical protein